MPMTFGIATPDGAIVVLVDVATAAKVIEVVVDVFFEVVRWDPTGELLHASREQRRMRVTNTPSAAR